MQEAYRFAISAGSVFPTGFWVASWRQDTLDRYLITLEYFKLREQLETIFRGPEQIAWSLYNKDFKMDISELHARVTCLERELREVRDLLAQAAHDAEAVTAELVRTARPCRSRTWSRVASIRWIATGSASSTM